MADGVLLVHGFTGTPFEMRFLGEHLAALGFAVEAPLLAGHLAPTAELASTRWPDWFASVEAAFERLKRRSRRVFVGGLSLGGLLTLELARRRGDEITAIAVMATALWLTRPAILLDRALVRVPILQRAWLPKMAGSDILDPLMKRLNGIAQGGAAMPLAALHSLIELGGHVRAHLDDVRTPALVAHSKRDHTVPFACMDALMRGLGSETLVPLELERSFHCITLDVERERLFSAVSDFFSGGFAGS